MIKVLYVEDDAINALVMERLLRNDFIIKHVSDGESCLELIKSERFDVILMDINLGRGRIDGVETMKRAKLFPGYETTPVVAVTSYALPEDRQRFLNEGFDYYFEKPVERTLLIEGIQKLLNGS